MSSASAVQAELMALLSELCEIPSPSRRERAVADLLIGRFRALGATVSEDGAAAAVGGDTGNLIAVLPGSKAGPTGRPLRVVLCAHMDTVPLVEGEPLRAVADGTVLRSTGRQILGSDDKAGVAIVLVLMSRLAALPVSERPTLVAAITVCEEVGLKGAHALDVAALAGDFGYCFDGEVPVGELIAGAVYKESLTITVRGRRAHAALEPELGVHAVLAAAELIRSFPLGRVAEDQVANIGSVQGGGASNVVPDRVVLQGEARAFSEARLEELIARIRSGAEAAVAPLGASFELERARLYDGYDLAETSEPFRRLVQTAPEHGVTPSKVVSIGGSDTNVLNQKGLPTVNVGMSMHEIHGVGEWIDTTDLAKVVLWLEDALRA